ncbi:KDO2-lipid IV(A) lauroyltransferase [Pararhizobium capsulatum DSM 1112]|uniref:KDO2-lipid IV(A) lauroyltransferase n=1 Tax=Pararhizobium capsulatum DSM 1112 TaxID=1121113 RepID=A0ABU0BJU6_9HYPH|nr:lysophospholipid acyltransferase family protein [Pararhizobium capsulatum]MDQ0318522.1 KDO2-lipid IV(A) lauroyltransferase [Pararhizobium capsulatum DSM 1112]
MKKNLRTKSDDPALTTRKAFVWEDEKAPPLADIVKGADARRRFFRYWIHDTLRDLPKLLSYNLLRLLPAGLASELGAFHYGAIRHLFPARNQRIAENLARIRPDLDPASTARLHWRSKGRVMAEFSVLARIDASDSVTLEGEENLREAYAQGPVVVLGLHLGNWELISVAHRRLKIPITTFYMPPESRVEHRIARHVRNRLDLGLFPPGVKGVRPAMKRLMAHDGLVAIFGDEGFDDGIMAPFFGRPTHLSGNLAIAVRLARHAGARIVPFYVVRKGGSRFICRWLKPIDLPETDDPGAALADDVERLNGVIEPIVSRHINQWYFLDHTL